MIPSCSSLQSILRKIGFNEKEAHVYLTLLELKHSLPSIIAKRTGMNRSTVYDILEHLVKKGVVGKIRKENALYFRAIHPSELLTIQKDISAVLERHLPDFLKLYEGSAAYPHTTVFEGENGLLHILEDTLTAQTEILCWNALVGYHGSILEPYYPLYLSKRVRQKLRLRLITVHQRAALALKRRDHKEYRETLLIPKSELPSSQEIYIYDDKIAFLSCSDQTGMIVRNEHIAATQRSMFTLAFTYARIREKELLSHEEKLFLQEKEPDFCKTCFFLPDQMKALRQEE